MAEIAAQQQSMLSEEVIRESYLKPLLEGKA